MRACVVEMHMEISQEPFPVKFIGKMPDADSATSILCEPAQSKRTWKFHKSHFLWKFTGKMPDADSRDIALCEPAQSKRTWTFQKSHFLWKFIGNMPDAPENTSIKHRTLTVTVRTP